MDNFDEMTALAGQYGKKFLTKRPEVEWKIREEHGFEFDEERWYSMWAYGRLSWDEYQVATACNIADKQHLYRPTSLVALPHDVIAYTKSRMDGAREYEEKYSKIISAWLATHTEALADNLQKVKTLKHAKRQLEMIKDNLRTDHINEMIKTLDEHRIQSEKSFLLLWINAKEVIKKDSNVKK